MLPRAGTNASSAAPARRWPRGSAVARPVSKVLCVVSHMGRGHCAKAQHHSQATWCHLSGPLVGPTALGVLRHACRCAKTNALCCTKRVRLDFELGFAVPWWPCSGCYGCRTTCLTECRRSCATCACTWQGHLSLQGTLSHKFAVAHAWGHFCQPIVIALRWMPHCCWPWPYVGCRIAGGHALVGLPLYFNT